MNLRLNAMLGAVLLSMGMMSGVASAKEMVYEIDPSHTYPSFEADHMGGLSMWRGKINQNSGQIILDKAKKTGQVHVVMDMASIDFGHDKMNEHAKAQDIFDVATYPQAIYDGKLVFKGDKPVKVVGNLTLKGKTQPVNLEINSFKCMEHPFAKKEVCGADAKGSFDRSKFGIDKGIPMFKSNVNLAIQIEALLKEEPAPAAQ